MTIAMFFQGALLAGYALAYWLLRQSAARACGVLAALAIAGAVVAKLPPWIFSRWPEWPAVLTGLTLSLLPTLLLTTSVGIVLQGWIRSRHGRVPFYLYGISNLGSTIALIVYPFLVEPRYGLSLQIVGMKILLWLLSALVLALCWLERKRSGVTEAIARDEPAEAVAGDTVAAWLVITFATCTLMLGAIQILSAEIGSNPLSWLIPLSIYLLSFTLTFSGWWRPALTQLCLVALGGTLFGYMLTKGISDGHLSLWPRAWLVYTVMAGCLTGHGFVYQLRPERRFALFYLVIATGGLMAGVFASVGAPNLFSRNYEFTGAAFFILVFVAMRLIAREGLLARLSLAFMLIVPPGWYAYDQLRSEKFAGSAITHFRNHYGHLIVTETTDRVTVSNETTLHGAQLRSEDARHVPTTYYAKGSAVGIVIDALQQHRSSIRVGAIGLGAGTLAAYARPADEIVFWEINPLAVKIARERFTFLQDCPGKVEIRLMDGRLGVRATDERFDVLVVDAFSGDSIPTHLITREALREYLDRLDNGILLVHVSNRYVNLRPVIAAGALHAGWHVQGLRSTPSAANMNREQANGSIYMVVYPAAREAEVSGWIDAALGRADYDYQVFYPDAEELVEWTDDRHAIADVLLD